MGNWGGRIEDGGYWSAYGALQKGRQCSEVVHQSNRAYSIHTDNSLAYSLGDFLRRKNRFCNRASNFFAIFVSLNKFL